MAFFDAALAAADGPGAAYVLRDAGLPVALVEGAAPDADRDGIARADVAVSAGRIAAIAPAGAIPADGRPVVDLDGGLVLPLCVDMHTHLDKGHIWPRRRNPDGRFTSALEAVKADREARWSAEDVRRRMDFALRSAYAHGTRAIRTHIDSIPPQHEISWPVFAETRAAWAGRIELQAVALVGPDTMLDPGALEEVARVAGPLGGVVGGAIAAFPHARTAIANVVATAARHGLDLDLHVDETDDPDAQSLRILAETVLATGFSGRVVAGHCCSLARQDAETQDRTMDLVARAGIAVVSLPMCNMYLQDRDAVTVPGGAGPRTPRWRGVTLVREMRARGIEVAISSDNTRDPFYAYGDLDGLEVLREGVRILQLDQPVGDFVDVVSRRPADILGLPDHGRLKVGNAADFLAVAARGYTELFARPWADRAVVRDGALVRSPLPDYRELDDLMEPSE